MKTTPAWLFLLITAGCGSSPSGGSGGDVGDVGGPDVVDDVESPDAGDTFDATDAADTVDAGDSSDGGDGVTQCLHDDPRESWVARSVEGCAVIDYDCAEEFTPFSNECGCGCRVPTEGECDPARFTTSGMAEAFAIGARCEFLVFCSNARTAAEIESDVQSAFPEATCTDTPDYSCPDTSTGASCLVYVDELDAREVKEACERTNVAVYDGFVCAGDL